MDTAERYVHRVRSGTFYTVLVLLCVFPVMGVGALFSDAHGHAPPAVTAALLAVLALAAGFYAFYVTEVVVTVDGNTVRHTQQDVAFGVRRALRVQWEFPRAELRAVREVTTRTPSSRGGWNQSSMLHFAGDRKISDFALGSKSDPASAYSRLAASLRAKLGEQFTTEEKV
jgi:hypothetical protein